MVTEDPKIARLSDRFVWRLGDLVRIGQAFVDAGIHQLRKFLSVEAEEPEIVVGFLQCRQFDRQQIVVPFRDLSGLVVGDSIRSNLLWVRCEATTTGTRSSQASARLQTRMADDDDTVAVDNNWLRKSKS